MSTPLPLKKSLIDIVVVNQGPPPTNTATMLAGSSAEQGIHDDVWENACAHADTPSLCYVTPPPSTPCYVSSCGSLAPTTTREKQDMARGNACIEQKLRMHNGFLWRCVYSKAVVFMAEMMKTWVICMSCG